MADDLFFPPDFAPRVVDRVYRRVRRGVLLRRAGLLLAGLLATLFALSWPRLHRAPAAQRSLVASAAAVCPWGPSPSFFGDGETVVRAQPDDDSNPLQ